MNRSQASLEPCKKVVRAFLADFEAVKLRWSLSDREVAYIWLTADPQNWRSFLKKLKTHDKKNYYKQPALPLYLQWKQEEKEIHYSTGKKIPEPDERQSLYGYLLVRRHEIIEKNETRCEWHKSLHSFLHFLREDMPLDQQGSLESLFPKKMKQIKRYHINDGEKQSETPNCQHILRKVLERAYPIDIFAAEEIIMNLANTVLYGRPNSQHTAAEALGFALLCLFVGFSRVLTRENILFSVKLDALQPPSPSQMIDAPYRPSHVIKINSLCGAIEVPISKMLHDFLIALPRDIINGNIFEKRIGGLHSTFQKQGVGASARCKTLGHITFLTFMSQPHEVIEHRASNKKKNHSRLRKLNSSYWQDRKAKNAPPPKG